MLPFRRRNESHALSVAMTGVKMGDHLAQIGCADGGRLGAIAVKVGLSGRAVAILPDEGAALRARTGAAGAGVLVEVAVAPPTRLPLEDHAFDLVVVDDTGGLLATLPAGEQIAAAREVLRTLKPGGRVMVLGAVPRSGWDAIVSRAPAGPLFDPQPALEAGGFRFVRHLAEREGLRFVEGLKSR